MHSLGIHSAMAIKRQRKRRDDQKKARDRRVSMQSSESGETLHSASGSFRRRFLRAYNKPKQGPANVDSKVVTSIGMLHIGIVFIVFGLFLIGAGIIPDEAMSWSVFSSNTVWWNEVTIAGIFSLVLGISLLVLNCIISRKEEEVLEEYVQHQLTRSRSGHRLERDVETGVLTTRHARKAVALHENGLNDSATDVALINSSGADGVANGPMAERNCLNASGEVLLEKIVEEDNSYINERCTGASSIEIENDTKHLLRTEPTSDTMNSTRI